MAFERDDNENTGTGDDRQARDELGSIDTAGSGQPGFDQSAADDSDAPVELGGQAADIRAENVTLTQGGASTIEATTVSITQGGAGRVRAGELTVSQGGVVLARADSLTVDEGGSAFVVMTDEATVNDGASVFLLLARSVRGEVRPVLDWRAALALGSGIGVVLSVLRRIR